MWKTELISLPKFVTNRFDWANLASPYALPELYIFDEMTFFYDMICRISILFYFYLLMRYTECFTKF